TFADRLTHGSQLSAGLAEDGRRFQAGHAYIAPFDRHLLLENGIMRLEHSPREQHARPCIDVLFKSAAAIYGRRVVRVLFSGMSSDGAGGLWHIKKRGGVTIVHDPEEAKFRVMPDSAIDSEAVDYVLALMNIAPALVSLAAPPVAGERQSSKILIVEDESV